MLGIDDPPAVQAGVADADLTGTTVLVTGSTSGIGRAGALALGELGAEVLVHGRDETAGEQVVGTIEASGGSARFLPADFEDPAAVSRLAETVRESVDTLDVLCNNAGGYFATVTETDLGVERTFHVNHLAAYQLTAELLPALGPGSRVATTSSIAHRGTILDLDLSGLSPAAAYCCSKLANVQFSNELARRLSAAGREVTANAFHPGVIPGSDFSRSFPGFSTELWQLLDGAPFLETIEQGATNLVYLAVADEVANTTGSYFARCREHRPSLQARDPAAMRELWERSAALLDMAEPLADAT